MFKRGLPFLLFLTSFFLVFAKEIDLSRYETSLYSGYGEDGVLAKIFELIHPSTPFCVDLGASDGITESATYLLRLQKWDCVLLDRAYQNPNYNLNKEFITAENIHFLFRHYDVPTHFGLLSISLDYNDFYIWNAIDPTYQPDVVVIAYNSLFPPTEDKLVQYHPYFCGDGTTYFGASILALYNLGRSKGYSLVYADQTGSKLFFVRNSVISKNGLTFKDMNNVEKLYRPLTSNKVYRQDSKKRSYISSSTVIYE